MKAVVEINNEKFVCTKIEHGEGSNSTCYLLNDDKVLKIYHSDILDYNVVYEENLAPLLEIKNGTFIFPERMFTNDEGIVTGYISPCIKGETLVDSSDSPLIKDFVEQIDSVYQDILSISKKGVFTCEMGAKNIIFNGKFYIIDTDTYFIINSIPEQMCLSHNLAMFNESILDYIVRQEKIDQNLFAFINKNSVLRTLWIDMTSKEDAKPLLKEFICELKSELESIHNTDIETFDDFHKVFRRVRR